MSRLGKIIEELGDRSLLKELQQEMKNDFTRKLRDEEDTNEEEPGKS